MNEIWKFVKGYEGAYKISNKGRVMSVRREVPWCGTTTSIPERILKHSVSTGYPCVTLCLNGKRSVRHVHRLIAQAFIPNPKKRSTVDHINGNKFDFRIKNLQWVTDRENKRRAWRSGIMENAREQLKLGYGARWRK